MKFTVCLAIAMLMFVLTPLARADSITALSVTPLSNGQVQFAVAFSNGGTMDFTSETAQSGRVDVMIDWLNIPENYGQFVAIATQQFTPPDFGQSFTSADGYSEVDPLVILLSSLTVLPGLPDLTQPLFGLPIACADWCDSWSAYVFQAIPGSTASLEIDVYAPVTTPEPGSLDLLGLGLLGLVGISCCKVTSPTTSTR